LIFLTVSPTPEIYTLSLHDALPILNEANIQHMLVKPFETIQTKLFPIIDEFLAEWRTTVQQPFMRVRGVMTVRATRIHENASLQDRKSTRLNSSHVKISYAVFCLKK